MILLGALSSTSSVFVLLVAVWVLIKKASLGFHQQCVLKVGVSQCFHEL